MIKTIKFLSFFMVLLVGFGAQALASSYTLASPYKLEKLYPDSTQVSTDDKTTNFNNSPSDSKTTRVMNYTKNPVCNTCWSDSTSAKKGEVVSMEIYFHNTGNLTAKGTYLKAKIASNKENYASLSGGVGAYNANYKFSSAVIYKPLKQRLVYIENSAKLYKTQSDITNNTPTHLSKKDVQNLFGKSGYNIGIVGTGWPNQGALVLQFKVVDEVIPS